MLEFTGERVVPGQVEVDLWNEHLARYLFAARLAGGKRVLDIGCGAGYGAAELARLASCVVALDVSTEAVTQARSVYALPNLRFLAASATAIPFLDDSFRLITCFEVIEHVADWQALLREARRLLARGGQFIVSTPNKAYYAETREQLGPNPFHIHEFEFEEFRDALAAVFPSVTLYLQNHVAGLSFQPVSAPNAQSPDLHLDWRQTDPSQAHFFVAVCAVARQTGAPAFLHIPSTSNVLRERESHVRKLADEIGLKDTWLQQHQDDLSQLLQAHTALRQELERAQHWAQEEHEKFQAARRELRESSQAYEARLAANELAANEILDTRTKEYEDCRRELLATAQAYEDRLATNERVANEILDARTKELEAARAWAMDRHQAFEDSRRELIVTSQAYEDRLAANERVANEILDARTKEYEDSRHELLATARAYEDRLAANERAANEILDARTKEYEDSRREMLAMAQGYEDRLAANERAANDLLNQRAKELEKAVKWAHTEHEQFEALGRELQATCDRYEALSAANARRHQEELGVMNQRLEELQLQSQAALAELKTRLAEAENDRQSAAGEIDHLRTILAFVQASRWVKLGRTIKVGPDLASL